MPQREEDGLYMAAIVTPKKHIVRANYIIAEGRSENYLDISTKLWHLRLAHSNGSVIKETIKSNT